MVGCISLQMIYSRILCLAVPSTQKNPCNFGSMHVKMKDGAGYLTLKFVD